MQTKRRKADPEAQTRFLYWWLLLALVFEYTRPGVHFPPLAAVPLNSTIPLTLFIFTFFAKGLRPWGEIFRDPMAKWITVFMGFVLVSMLWAENRTRTLDTFEKALGYFFMFIMIVRIVTTEQRVRGVFFTLILCHFFLLLMNMQVVLDPSVRHYLRGAPFMGDGNDYALSVCLLVPFAIQVSLTAKTKLRQIMCWSMFLLLVLAIVGTQSRGATLGIGAVFGYLWLQSSRKGVTMVAIGIVACIAILFAPDVYFERMSTIAEYQQESSAQSRIEAWKAGTRMALDNPLGVGSGNFPNNFPKYRGPNAPVRWMTAHSMYFLVLGELGFLGLLLWLKLVIGNIRMQTRMRRLLLAREDLEQTLSYRQNLYMLSASFVGLAVAGAFLSVTYYPHIFVLNGLALAYRAIVVNNTGISLVTRKEKTPGRLQRRAKPATPSAEPNPATR